jgi:hypothetical protein
MKIFIIITIPIFQKLQRLQINMIMYLFYSGLVLSYENA